MNFSQSESDFIKDAESYVPVRTEDKPVIDTEEALEAKLRERVPGRLLDMQHTIFKGLDLAG